MQDQLNIKNARRLLVLLAAALICSLPQLGNGEPLQKSTPAEMVDALNGVFGKQTTGRAVHAEGIVVEGSFTPDPAASALSKAPHLQKSKVKVTGRFSNFAGLLVVPDTDPLASPRGLALKFHLPDGSDTDLVTHSFNGFPAATADEFRAFLTALGTSGSGTAAPTPADKYLAAHPLAKNFLATQPGPPVSFGTISYFGVNAFKFTNAAGTTTFARYRIEPVKGERFLSKGEIAAASPDYLQEELRQRLPGNPLRFNFVAQIAEHGDRLDDPSIAWPDSRKRVQLGMIEFDSVATDSMAREQALLFLPMALPSGIEAADPMLKARHDAYPVSFARRHQ